MRSALICVGALVAFSSTLSACSTISDYWRKPTKYKQMPDKYGWAPPVATLSLDATRRLVISQQLPPAPDQRLHLSRTAARRCAQHPFPDPGGGPIEGRSVGRCRVAVRRRRAGPECADLDRRVLADHLVDVLRTSDEPSAKCGNGLPQCRAVGDQQYEGYGLTLPTAASLPGLIGEARQAQAEADKKAEEAAAAPKAADAKKQAAAAAAALEQAKQECAKVPDDKKEADENCKKVKEAAAS